MLKINDCVKLKENHEESGVSISQVGAVVDILSNGDVCTVEFVNEDGETILLEDFYLKDLIKV